jgi:hypothetical protein
MNAMIDPGAVADETLSRVADALVADDGARRMLTAQLKRRRTMLEFVVQGASMLGSLPNGCRIRITCEPGLPAPGAVIGVLIGKCVVRVHRILWRGRRGAARGWVVTRGDALTFPDMPHDEATLLGRVTEVEIDGVWRPVPPPLRHRRPGISSALAFLVAIALEINPHLARHTANRLRQLKPVYHRLSGFALPRRIV